MGENYITSLKKFLFLYFFLSKVDFVFFLKVFACSQIFFKLCRKKLTLSVYYHPLVSLLFWVAFSIQQNSNNAW